MLGRISKDEQKMKTKLNSSILDDGKVNVKTKLALLWVALMFFYIYNDLFSMFQPGHVADLVEGHLEGLRFTQTILLGAAASEYGERDQRRRGKQQVAGLQILEHGHSSRICRSSRPSSGAGRSPCPA